jgi:polyhydroxyalkanoate synthase
MLDRIMGALRQAQRPRPRVGSTPAFEVHRENKWRLLRYVPRAPGPAFRTPVVLIPSLINRHYVLDLMPGKSFAEWLVAKGHDVYCIDWGTPSDEDRYVDFDDVADRAIGRAIRVACRTAGAEKAHVLGYCLGGTLAVIHAAVRPEHVASLTLLAAPIAFHDDGLLSTWTRTKNFDVDALVAGAGNVPWQLLQSAFHMLRPTLNLQKAVTMLDKAWDDEFMDGFLAIETWGSDNVSFPGACYRTYIEELYRADGLLNETFALSGHPVRLRDVRCPVLAVTFEHDSIVPWQSAAIVLDRIGSEDKHRLHLAGGHVGAVVSKKAAAGLWPALSTFWADREVPAPAVAPQVEASPMHVASSAIPAAATPVAPPSQDTAAGPAPAPSSTAAPTPSNAVAASAPPPAVADGAPAPAEQRSRRKRRGR